MPALVDLALLLLVSAVPDFHGGVTLEGRGGSTPIDANSPPHSEIAWAMTPEAGVNWYISESSNLKLRYFPTLTSVYLDGVGAGRRYVLHQAELVALLRTSRRITCRCESAARAARPTTRRWRSCSDACKDSCPRSRESRPQERR